MASVQMRMRALVCVRYWLQRGISGDSHDVWAPLASALSNLVVQGLRNPFLAAISAGQGVTLEMPRLAYHWPLVDGLVDVKTMTVAATKANIHVVSGQRLVDGGATRNVVAFHGVSDRAHALASVTGLSERGLSIGVWVKVGDDMDEWVTIWSFDSSSSGLRCELSNSGDAQLWANVANARVSTAYGTPQLSLKDGQWHHVVAVYDAARYTATLYIDGQALRGTYSGADASTSLLVLGCHNPVSLHSVIHHGLHRVRQRTFF